MIPNREVMTEALFQELKCCIGLVLPVVDTRKQQVCVGAGWV